jgi:hypothetical protein
MGMPPYGDPYMGIAIVGIAPYGIAPYGMAVIGIDIDGWGAIICGIPDIGIALAIGEIMFDISHPPGVSLGSSHLHATSRTFICLSVVVVGELAQSRPRWPAKATRGPRSATKNRSLKRLVSCRCDIATDKQL